MNHNLATIIIPAYQPGRTLVTIVTKILKARPEQAIIVVNDGSDLALQKRVFDKVKALGVTVLHHAVNLGKGEALKTGFNYYLSTTGTDSPGVVTADADGQHAVKDILAICKALEQNANALYLGVRGFSKKSIPLRSRFGNILTRFIFRQLTHADIEDTQTGLRGIPREFAKQLISSKLSGYEFELEMLLHATRQKLPLKALKIKTIYKDKNITSHFNPLLDSLKIYFVFIRFTAISLLSAALDFLLFALGFALTHKIFISIFAARLISGIFNFTLNKSATFKSPGNTLFAAIKYLCLALALVFTSYMITRGISSYNVNVYLSKFIAEILLFLASFSIQQLFIFRRTDEITK